jgi:hypothetical protein
MNRIPIVFVLLVACLIPVPVHGDPPPQPIVEVEEDVYRSEPANNGAGPMWCSGSTCLVRTGGHVFASGLETLAQHKPLNNCRWLLFQRATSGWELQQADPTGRTREPCPLAAFHDGRLFLSANPTLTPPDQYGGPARPEILQFDSARPKEPFQTLLPQWDGTPAFSEHSYRSLAADGARGELILLQNIGYAHAEWAFRDADGQWSAQGKLAFPWGAEYEKPEPVRLCYPNVMLKDRAVYFCGVSDIVEPNLQWRAYKKELTGQNWDYDFRRLFFTWTEDITQGKFHDWIEIASREKTCGWIFPCDLWVAADGVVHLLWSERALDTRLREKFFPEAKQSQALNYAQIRGGQVTGRRALVLAEEGAANLVAGAARFHVTPDQRLWVICYVSGTEADGKSVSENRLFELSADGTATEPVRIPLSQPFTSFFTATIRGGSPPADILDLLGVRAGGGNAISYARIRLPAAATAR